MTKTFLLRARDEDMARWKGDAEAAGYTFADWVRTCLDNPGSAAPENAPAPAVSRVQKKGAKNARPRGMSKASSAKGACPAYAARGTRCKLCGKLH